MTAPDLAAAPPSSPPAAVPAAVPRPSRSGTGAPAGRRHRPGRARRPGRADVALGLLVGAGVLLRVGDMAGYRRAMMLWGDSWSYLLDAARLEPSGQHPLGYPLLLAVLRPFQALVVVPVLQHLLGLGLGLGTYLLLRRLGVGKGLALLGAAPVLLDPYQVQLEQFVLAETWTSVLLLAVLALLFVPVRPSVGACAAAGAVLVLATLSRTVAGVMLLPLLVAALHGRWGRRGTAGLVGVTLAPLALYAVWFHAGYGRYGLDNLGSRALYGRTAMIADCPRLSLTAQERRLCDLSPRGLRQTPDFYSWGPSPLNLARFPRGVRALDVAGAFNRAVVEQQPLDYGRLVAEDFLHYWGADRVSTRDDWNVAAWQMQPTIRPREWKVLMGPTTFTVTRVSSVGRFPAEQSVHQPVGLMRSYQKHVYVPGWFTALGCLLGLAAAVRHRSRDLPGVPRRLVAFTGVAAGGALVLTAVPALFVPFDFRYLVLPQLLAAPALAGALALWRADRARTDGSARWR